MKTRRKKKKEPLVKKIASRFDLPEDVLFDIPRTTLYDNSELRIENYKTVLEYEDTNIKLACKERFIQIAGTNLNITVITDDEISVKGIITSIEFL